MTALSALPGLNIPAHDFISLGYSDGRITQVTYKLGGNQGAIVAVLTLGYTDNQVTSIFVAKP